MKKLSIAFGTILLVFGCFALSPAVKADSRPTPLPQPAGPPIVGLWHVSLYLDPGHTTLFAETYKQWHSDRLEFESANLFPGAHCVGTWRQMASNMVSLYHVGWTPGGVPGFPTAVRFVETETNTVSPDGNSYNGTGEQTFYDQSGNPLATIMLYIDATRLPPQ